jgi:hypothetical protein
MEDNPSAQDLSALLKQLVNNEYIPESIRTQWWILTSESTILSCHSKEQIHWQMNQFDLLELRTIRKLPGHQYGIDQVILINQIKMEYSSRLWRSFNGFEREAQISQKSSETLLQGTPRGIEGTGFFSSVKNLISGGH